MYDYALRLLLILVLGASAQIFNCTDNGVLPFTDDGRQNAATGCPSCVEWWFFTAFSPSANVGAALSYDPANKELVAMIYLNAASPATATVVNIERAFDGATSTASNASVQLGTDGLNSITVVDATHYVVRGAIPASNISWTLTFEQAVDAASEKVDLLDGVLKLDWLSYMPNARVSGILTYQGVAYSFDGDGQGYHDHNSGKWPSKVQLGTTAAPPVSDLLSFDYKWGSVGDGKGTGAVYGAYLGPGVLSGLSVDYIFVRSGSTRVKFGTLCGHRVTVKPLGFIDRAGGHKEASAVQLTAESDEWKLEWTHRMLSSAVNPGGVGLQLIVYEQLSTHNLTLTKKAARGGVEAAGAGEEVAVASLSGAWGFTEWSNPA